MECAQFEELVAELVLDLPEPSVRAEALAHAATCARCRAELQSLSAIADLVGTTAPECEPLPGFEARAVARFDTTEARWSRPPRRWGVVALAAAASLLLGLVVGRLTLDEHSDRSDRTAIGTLVAADGSEHGWVALASSDGAAALTMHLAALPPGTYRCVMVAADGRTTEVAAWPIGDSGRGEWTVAVDPPTTAEQVLLLSESGATVATATFAG